MKKYYLSFLGLCILLVSCGSNPNDDLVLAPVVNPSPKYFMTVEGFIDPKLKKDIDLQIQAFFITNTDSCEKKGYGVYEAAMVPRHRWVIYLAKPDVNGNYKIVVPIDYFMPGRCEWSLSYIQYQYKNIEPDAGGNVFAYFDPAGEKDSKEKAELYACDKSNCSSIKSLKLFDMSSHPFDVLSLQFNYLYQISFMYKKPHEKSV